MFGCCSSFEICSDNLGCLHSDDNEYIGCQYRKNLEAGKVFYGKNAGKVIAFPAKPVVIEPTVKIEETIEPIVEPTIAQPIEVYISCYNRLFAVYSQNKNGNSYALKPFEKEALELEFARLDIPYKVEATEPEIVTEGSVEDPANSRVVFSLGEQKFRVLNANSYLIKRCYADGIVKAFKAKGLDARIELIGSYARTVPVPAQKASVPVQDKKPIEEVKVEKVEVAKVVELPDPVITFENPIITAFRKGYSVKLIIEDHYRLKKAFDKEYNKRDAQVEVETTLLQYWNNTLGKAK